MKKRVSPKIRVKRIEQNVVRVLSVVDLKKSKSLSLMDGKEVWTFSTTGKGAGCSVDVLDKNASGGAKKITLDSSVTFERDGFRYELELFEDFYHPGRQKASHFLTWSVALHLVAFAGVGYWQKMTQIKRLEEAKPDMDRVLEIVKKMKMKRKPKPVVKKQAPPKKQMASTSPKKTETKVAKQKAPAVAKKPSAADIARAKAMVRAKLAKSLNFLSKSPGDFAARMNYKDLKFDQKIEQDSGKKNYLNKLAATNIAQGPVDTGGSIRAIGTISTTGKGARGGRFVEGVQSKVASNDLSAGGVGFDTGGLRTSGDGSIDQALIERTLAKYMAKFQYCYERSLLTEPTLAGNVSFSWNLTSSGKAEHVQVVKSQLNHAGLHGCIEKVISAVKFPSPKGGTVTVKYPFNFSSTSI